MQSALSLAAPPPLDALMQRCPVALFLDFDGTLVELAEGPDAISPADGLARRLMDLAERLHGRCAIVSGRSIDDIEKHTGVLSLAMAGSHGSDIRAADGRAVGEGAAGLPEEIEQELRSYAARHDLDYEHKPHGGALHYRRNPDSGLDAHAFADALAERHGWKAQGGKCVVEIVATDADKGSAVSALMKSDPFNGAIPVFIGDDLTDEAGFGAARTLGGFGILVGARDQSCADHSLPDVASVHQWLEL